MNRRHILPRGKSPWSCLLVILLLFLFAILWPRSAQCNHIAGEHVLIVHSYHQDFPWTDSIMAGMVDVIHREAPEADIHVEYLDAKRTPPEQMVPSFKELLVLKYGESKPDVILVSDDAAFQAMLALRAPLFPGVPLIFCGVNEFTDAMIASMTDITGVVEDFDLHGTLEIALRLHPRSRHVAVITDSTETGRINLERFRQIKPSFGDRFESIELAEMSAEELTGRLHQLPDDTVLLLLAFFRDRAGRYFTVSEMLHLIAEASALPLYVSWDYMMGTRALGGRVVSGRQQGEAAARMAARILQGTPAAFLPIVRTSPNIPMFDQIELQRFGIDPVSLPKGSVVINAPPSLPSRYLWSMTGFFVLALAQGLIILALIRNTRRYKTSQKALRQSEEKYRVLFSIFPLGITLTDRSGNILETNEVAARLLGVPRDEHLARSLESDQWSIIRPDGTPMPPQEYAAVRALRENCPVENVEMGIVRPDATTIWINVTAAPLNLEQYGVVVAYGDITERKQAVELLVAQERKFRDLFEANQDGISLFRINPDRTPAPFVDVNEAATAMVGYSKLELAEMTAMDVEIEVSPDVIAQRVAALEKTGQIRFETILIAKDRRKIPVEVLARAIVYEGGPAVMNIVRDISERKQAEAALQASLAEKNALLREVHHRVKNNLAAIIGLFDLQRQAMDDPQALTVLAELSGRIRSMSLVHEKLYRSDSLASIDFQEYLQSLTSHLRTSFGTARIRLDIAALGVPMPLDQAVPCGMIINELVTNALKYAFPGNGTHPRDGDCRIHVAVSRAHNTFTLSVADNGVGLPADFDWSTSKTLGLTLVRMLGQHQLGGRFEVDLQQGTHFTLTFSSQNRTHSHE